MIRTLFTPNPPAPPATRFRKSEGFSLLEVLVATAIMGLVMVVMAYAGGLGVTLAMIFAPLVEFLRRETRASSYLLAIQPSARQRGHKVCDGGRGVQERGDMRLGSLEWFKGGDAL